MIESNWRDCLIESGGNKKRPVIERELSGPFLSAEDRRILATRSDGCTNWLRSRDGIREVVGRHLEQHPPITRDRGPRVVRPQQNSVWAVSGRCLAFEPNLSLRSRWLCLRRPDRGLRTPSLRYGVRLKTVVTLRDRSLRPIQPVGNQQTARSDQPARDPNPPQCCLSTQVPGMIEVMSGEAG